MNFPKNRHSREAYGGVASSGNAVYQPLSLQRAGQSKKPFPGGLRLILAVRPLVFRVDAA